MKQPASLFETVKQLVSEVPWRHNFLIIQKVKNVNARIFYLQRTAKNRYIRSVLTHQIEADVYGNFVRNPSQHNFETVLPLHKLEQTQESIKSVYSFDFFDINKPMTERQLEASMVERLKALPLSK